MSLRMLRERNKKRVRNHNSRLRETAASARSEARVSASPNDVTTAQRAALRNWRPDISVKNMTHSGTLCAVFDSDTLLHGLQNMGARASSRRFASVEVKLAAVDGAGVRTTATVTVHSTGAIMCQGTRSTADAVGFMEVVADAIRRRTPYKDVQLRNIRTTLLVAVVYLQLRIDLDVLAQLLPNNAYERATTSRLCHRANVRYVHPVHGAYTTESATFIVINTGTVIITGVRSIEAARAAERYIFGYCIDAAPCKDDTDNTELVNALIMRGADLDAIQAAASGHAGAAPVVALNDVIMANEIALVRAHAHRDGVSLAMHDQILYTKIASEHILHAAQAAGCTPAHAARLARDGIPGGDIVDVTWPIRIPHELANHAYRVEPKQEAARGPLRAAALTRRAVPRRNAARPVRRRRTRKTPPPTPEASP